MKPSRLVCWTSRVLPLLLALWWPPFASASSDTVLVMFDQADCPYCARWRAEVGVIYHKTEEGQRAPLRRIDLNDPLPADLPGLSGASLSPVFVLWHNGAEVGRILGYSGEEFFWGLLENMLASIDHSITDQ